MQSVPEWRQAAQEALILEQEMKARRAVQDDYFWLTECTKTKDEQDPRNPYKPFPKKPYFKPVLDVLSDPSEPVVMIWKSRTMMASWLVSGWAAHWGFKYPATTVVFQSQDEDRAVHDVECVKTLWRNSDTLLQQRWKPKKDIDKQPYNRLEMENGSQFIGIPGDPQKIRSEHPTIVILDEAAFILRGEESYNVAVATRCLKIVALSSADKGWYDEIYQKSRPCDWPDSRIAA